MKPNYPSLDELADVNLRPLWFRAWDSKRKRWLSGIKTLIDMEGAIYHMEAPGQLVERGLLIGSGIHVLQKTGMADRNGCDIYEGDVVQVSLTLPLCVADDGSLAYGHYESVGVVKYEVGAFVVATANPTIGSKYLEVFYTVGSHIEVLGSIYSAKGGKNGKRVF
jgi:uncharacterized phage protein (TIGR01671 family)